MSAVVATRLKRRLERCAEPVAATSAERQFPLLSLAMLALCAALGVLLSAVEVTTVAAVQDDGRHHVTVELDAVNLFRPQPKPEPELAPVAEPPRLDPATVLAQAVDRPAISEPVAKIVAAVAPEIAKPPPPPAPRRVYGVRKVYARGLGSGTATDPGLLTKRGNTLDGRRDTLTATEADLQGELAALSSVEKAPEPVHRAKPIYSQALVAARAQGVVTAYLLVDVDGSVRDVEITEDIGHDSRAVAVAAFRRFRFRPALRGGEAVAVWILHRIRFEFQE